MQLKYSNNVFFHIILLYDLKILIDLKNRIKIKQNWYYRIPLKIFKNKIF